MRDAVVAFTTCENWDDARHLAKQLVEAKLAACVNLIPQVESIYHWQGKLVTGQEILLFIKTRRACLPALGEMLDRVHPYEIPELIALPVEGGLEGYLRWIAQEAIPPGERGGPGSGEAGEGVAGAGDPSKAGKDVEE